MVKIFNSAKSIHHFIDDYYLKLPQEERICYEMIGDVFYMYFDLDLELKSDIHNEDLLDHSAICRGDLNETNLFYWFDSIYREFIDYSIANNTDIRTGYVSQVKEASGETKLIRASLNFLKPEWIVTAASDHTKLSLHLVNRNVVFDNLDRFKQFYRAFQEFLKSFVPKEHPFFKAFDISVASKNRSMRLCGSQKLGSTRILRPFKEVHPMGLKLRDTFINDAPYDPKLQQKIFTEAVAESLWDKEERNTKTSSIQHFEPIQPEKKESESSYKMPAIPTSESENQEAEKAKLSRLEYERKDREAEYTKNWLLEQKQKSKERYLKNKEQKRPNIK